MGRVMYCHRIYESIYNAVINDVREFFSKGREPTNSSVKINTGKDNMNLTKEKMNAW